MYRYFGPHSRVVTPRVASGWSEASWCHFQELSRVCPNVTTVPLFTTTSDPQPPTGIIIPDSASDLMEQHMEMSAKHFSEPASPIYPPRDPRAEYLHDPTYGRNARAKYPRFLSLPETLLLQVSWAWKGLIDAFRWDIVAAVAVG